MLHSCSCASSKAPLPITDRLQMKGKENQPQPAPDVRARVAVAVDVCLAAACLGGAALLAWWALRFQHPYVYAQLWMVPVGLVLACTPVVVCVALRLSPGPVDDARVPSPSSVVVVVK